MIGGSLLHEGIARLTILHYSRKALGMLILLAKNGFQSVHELCLLSLKG